MCSLLNETDSQIITKELTLTQIRKKILWTDNLIYLLEKRLLPQIAWNICFVYTNVLHEYLTSNCLSDDNKKVMFVQAFVDENRRFTDFGRRYNVTTHSRLISFEY